MVLSKNIIEMVNKNLKENMKKVRKLENGLTIIKVVKKNQKVNIKMMKK